MKKSNSVLSDWTSMNVSSAGLSLKSLYNNFNNEIHFSIIGY